MTQKTIDRLVAHATGENLREIRRMGFTLADQIELHFDPEPTDRRGRSIDWDTVDPYRSRSISLQRPRKQLA